MTVPHHIVNWGEPNWVLTSQFHLLSLSASRLRVLGLWEHWRGSDILISRDYSKQIPLLSSSTQWGVCTSIQIHTLFPQLGRL